MPFTIGNALSSLGLVTGLLGGFVETRQKQQIASQNASLSRERARVVRHVAEIDAGEFRRSAKFAQASITAQFAASGVVATAGSAAQVRLHQVATDAFQELRILEAGQLEANGLFTQAGIFDMQKKQVGRQGLVDALTVGVKATAAFLPDDYLNQSLLQ